ncbi:MAG: helix-turn-helix domain-containing protein, partial [Pseudomonadota bacterium]|nr:helix-turn-helix domain-containing protein [Pseudomonadota bacterium]
MSYQQLTEGKRYQISVLLAQGSSATAIARAVEVHRSTVYRELKRNSDQEAYDPEHAQKQAVWRRT